MSKNFSIKKFKIKRKVLINASEKKKEFLNLHQVIDSLFKLKIKRKYGKILNISSIFGVVSKNKRSIYSTTKFALNGFTKGLSLDLAKNNIQVNSICPGVVETELTKKILGNIGMKKIRSEIPLGRLAKVKEISNLVIFLTSEYCNYITGQNIIIDGGYTAK